MIRAGLALAAALMPVAMMPVATRAAEPPCLLPDEFAALATYALPDVITGVAQKCGPTLGANAYIKTDGPAMIARYGAARGAAWPGAKAALAKMSAGTEGEMGALLRGLPDANQQALLTTIVAGVVAEKLPAERCGAIDTTLRLMAPLPPENTAQIIGLAVGLGSRTGQARLGKFQICNP